MRIVFMGTPDFAVPSLEILLKAGYDIVGVVTATAKMGGRGKNKVLKSAIKQFAEEKGLNILQPPNLKAKSFVDVLKSLRADLQIVVAFRMLPEVVWNMPPKGTYNLHGSLLPAYRGAAPINWAIMNGDTITGVTCFKLKHEIDTGDMLLQKEIPLYFTDYVDDLHDRMKNVGADVVLQTVQMVESGNLNFVKQDILKVSKAPKIYTSDCFIDFSKRVNVIYNFIRGLGPFPGARMMLNERILKVYKSEFEVFSHGQKPGIIIHNGNQVFKITALDGYILPMEVQMEGRKKMKVQDFLRGQPFD